MGAGVAEREKRMENRLGIWGWLGGGRYGPERYAYALHRVAGMALLLYLLLHIVLTSARAFGEAAWRATMAAVAHPVFKLGEYLVFAAFAYHALNGVRLILVELGIGLGRPAVPIYPYGSSVQRQRPLLIACMLLAALLLLLGGLDLFLPAR
jgi:succinate dehydrogenase / fumarate reductase cytochrome b subunit